jgi:hypothetical protein
MDGRLPKAPAFGSTMEAGPEKERQEIRWPNIISIAIRVRIPPADVLLGLISGLHLSPDSSATAALPAGTFAGADVADFLHEA